MILRKCISYCFFILQTTSRTSIWEVFQFLHSKPTYPFILVAPTIKFSFLATWIVPKLNIASIYISSRFQLIKKQSLQPHLLEEVADFQLIQNRAQSWSMAPHPSSHFKPTNLLHCTLITLLCSVHSRALTPNRSHLNSWTIVPYSCSL